MTQSVWIIRDRESGHYWHGFGYTPYLNEARLFVLPPPLENEYSFLPFPADVLELRLIERDSDAS